MQLVVKYLAVYFYVVNSRRVKTIEGKLQGGISN
jgi:hypothetical protein